MPGAQIFLQCRDRNRMVFMLIELSGGNNLGAGVTFWNKRLTKLVKQYKAHYCMLAGHLHMDCHELGLCVSIVQFSSSHWRFVFGP